MGITSSSIVPQIRRFFNHESSSTTLSNQDFESLIDTKTDDLINIGDFKQKVQMAQRKRKQNVNSIKTFIECRLTRKEKYCPAIQNVIRMCNDLAKSSLKVAVVGSQNSGKSMLTSLLLENKDLKLPSTDEPTTRIVTKIFYSDRPVMREISNGQATNWKEFCDVQELIMEYMKISNNERLDTLFSKPIRKSFTFLEDYFKAEREYYKKLSRLHKSVELGLPSDILKSDIEIIDFPGFDEDAQLCTSNLALLRQYKPSIICYVYDSNQRFGITNAKQLNEINKALYWDDRQSVQYMLIANKFDLIKTLNPFDCEDCCKTVEDIVSAEMLSVKLSCSFDLAALYQHKLTHLSTLSEIQTDHYSDVDIMNMSLNYQIGFLIQRLLPVLPISTANLLLSTDNQEKKHLEMLREFQNCFVTKIVHHSISTLIYTIHFILISTINQQKKIDILKILKSTNSGSTISE